MLKYTYIQGRHILLPVLGKLISVPQSPSLENGDDNESTYFPGLLGRFAKMLGVQINPQRALPVIMAVE